MRCVVRRLVLYVVLYSEGDATVVAALRSPRLDPLPAEWMPTDLMPNDPMPNGPMPNDLMPYARR
jgi:hypothetical protein